MNNVTQGNFGAKSEKPPEPRFTTVEVRTFKDVRFGPDGKELPARVIEQHLHVPFQGTEPNQPFTCRFVGYFVYTEQQCRQQQTPEGIVNIPVGQRQVRQQFEFPQSMTELRVMFENYEKIATEVFDKTVKAQEQTLAVPQKPGLIL